MSPSDDADREMNRRGLLGPGQRAYLAAFAPENRVLRFLSGGDALRADLETGTVRATRGDVVYGPRRVGGVRGAWFAHTADGAELDIFMARTPLPGPHVFYVAPTSGRVVGTEGETPSHVAQYQAVLDREQGLEPNDWAPIRDHFIPRKLASIVGRPPNTLDASMGVFVFLVGLLVAGLAPLLLVGGPVKTRIPAVVMPIAFLVGGFFWGVRPWLRAGAGLRSGRSRVLEGSLKKTSSGGKSPSSLFVVDGVEVDVTNRGALYDLVAEGVVHRLHVTDANVLVAIEVAR